MAEHKTKAPYVPPNVVEWLLTIFPDRIPKDPEVASLSRLVGQQDVIRRMKAAADTQNPLES